jgi:hypothetical protein
VEMNDTTEVCNAFRKYNSTGETRYPIDDMHMCQTSYISFSRLMYVNKQVEYIMNKHFVDPL